MTSVASTTTTQPVEASETAAALALTTITSPAITPTTTVHQPVVEHTGNTEAAAAQYQRFCNETTHATLAQSTQAISSKLPWSATYQDLLATKLKAKQSELATYRNLQYPNLGFESILINFPTGKVLVFGYGSLMNKASLGGTANAAKKPAVKPEAVASMRPVVAFGLKRLFNYEDQKKNPREFANEKALLNLEPSSDTDSVINGVTIEVDGEDFANLVKRELGYDLVPILITSWDDAIAENPNVEIQVAYTFMASKDPREGITYANDQNYPLRWYVRLVETAAETHGPVFAKMWKDTSYLANGVTGISDWDQSSGLAGQLTPPASTTANTTTNEQPKN